MRVLPIKTKRFEAPKDDLISEIKKCVRALPERSILVITSKVAGIDEGRCVSLNLADKDTLAKQESDLFLPRTHVPGEYVLHTITNGTLIGAAGIDASNAGNYYVMWPKDPQATARRYYEILKHEYRTSEFGVLLVDSRSMPLKRGVVGIAVASAGFREINDKRGDKDLFGREIKFALVNIPDALAAAAVVTMGETDEQTPLALITDIPFVTFTEASNSSARYSDYKVELDEDIYRPFLTVPWQKGKKGGTKKE